MDWQKAVSLAAALAIVGGVTVAGAQNGGGGNGVPARNSATGRSTRDLGTGITEAKYVGIKPCRIIDTRLAGGLAVGTARHVAVRGIGAVFAAQGGKAGGCGIPAAATSIEATLTAVQATGTGYLRAYPSGGPEPAATFINYMAGFNPSNTGSITLGCETTCPANDDLQAMAHDAQTHLVIDVQGYSIKPLAALVDKFGALIRSSRAVSSNAVAGQPGESFVFFDRDVSECNLDVTLHELTGNGYAVTAPSANDNTAVYVRTLNAGGTPQPLQYYLQVVC